MKITDEAWAAGGSGILLRTTNGGKSWSPDKAADDIAANLYSVNVQSDPFNSFQSLKLKARRNVSQAINSLQGCYGLQQAEKNISSEVCELYVYQKGGVLI